MKILYIDMDNVLVDSPSAFPKIDRKIYDEHKGNDNLDEVDGIFSLMKPIPGAIKAIDFLSQHFGVYIRSTAPWENPSAWKDKLLWIKKHLVQCLNF